MERTKALKPHPTELIARLIAESEHLIEEGRLLAREIETAKEELRTLARVVLPKPAQSRSSVANKDTKKAG
jgi:hypothetical protein